MKKVPIKWGTREFAQAHKAKVLRKLDKIQTLRVLVEMHEALEQPDFDYLRGLKARLRSVESQYRAMKPV